MQTLGGGEMLKVEITKDIVMPDIFHCHSIAAYFFSDSLFYATVHFVNLSLCVIYVITSNIY